MPITRPASQLLLIATLFGAQACGREAATPSPGTTTAMSRAQGKADWSTWPQLDPTLSCVGGCGLLAFDPSAFTYCGCDDACAATQDCCADKAQACDAPPAPPPSCDYGDADRDWTIKDWPKCLAASIACPAGTKYFEEPGCGCGCEQVPAPSCDYADPLRKWASQDWSKCPAIRIGCDPGWAPFQEVGCGCGCEAICGGFAGFECPAGYECKYENGVADDSFGSCVPAPAPTCDYANPQRDYFSQQPMGCAAMLIRCEPGWDLFSDACGCGCEDKVPACIRALIAQLGSEPVANPPASITLFEYKGQRVYYLPPSGWDDLSALYDEQCNVICAPDGGFAGTGDGRCPDFFQTAKSLGQIWSDPRR